MLNSIKNNLFFYFLFISFLALGESRNEINMDSKKIIRIGIIKDYPDSLGIKDRLSKKILAMITTVEKEELSVKYGTLLQMRTEFEEGRLDMIFPVERNHVGRKDSIFSENLYTQDFYIASNTRLITGISQLANETIYIPKGSVHKEHLLRILRNNDIYARVIEVDNPLEYSDKIIAGSQCDIYHLKKHFLIGVLPSAAIESREQFADNLTKINDALKLRVRQEIIEERKNLHQSARKQKFFNSLTAREIEYLEQLKKINVGYEENSTVSHYLKENKSYGGLTPLLLEEISKELNIPIKIINSPFESWEKILNKFNSGSIDLISMARTSNREKRYLFTKKISELKLYKIHTLDKTNLNGRGKIGVIESTIEDELITQYYHPDEIVRFKSFEALIKTFRSGKIDGVITFDSKLVTGKKIVVEPFFTVPINIAFQKENFLLRNIFDKALIHLVDKEEFLKNFAVSEREYLENKANLATYYSYLMSLVIICFILFIMFVIYRIRTMKKIAELAFIDSLSTLGNRYSFDKFCSSFNDKDGVTIVIDLDNFKFANDKYGHDIGDTIITHCAQIFKNLLPHNRIFRISGDEYYAFIDSENYQEILQKLKLSFESSEFLKNYGITCSIGYYLKSKDIDIAEGFRYADLAMYQAKLEKGTTLFHATEKFIKKSERENFIRDNIETSIENEFYPVYQAKMSLDQNARLIGAEALARWKSSSLGIIFPDEFISVAEEKKIIGKLDLKIAESAIIQVKKWLEEKAVSDDFIISFNISMITFETENVPLRVEELLKKHGVSGKNIELEITESIITKNMSETLEKLNRIKTLGISLSLDDFTAGHSTAGVLPLLPIDIVKFDRSLMLSIDREREKGTLVYTTLINLIKSMGFAITAEGVEKPEEVDFLKGKGVENAQGYLFGKPIPEDEFSAKFLSI